MKDIIPLMGNNSESVDMKINGRFVFGNDPLITVITYDEGNEFETVGVERQFVWDNTNKRLSSVIVTGLPLTGRIEITRKNV